MANTNRYISLDWLRAFAALGVFIQHFYQQSPVFFEKDFIAPVCSHLGAWGVTVFFVLSGFCIHNSRLSDFERGFNFDVRKYAIRRFFRIYPAFVACILVCFIIGQYFDSNLIHQSSIYAVLSHLSLVSAFSSEYRGGVNQVLWSVVLECHFYILYAMLWKFFKGLKATVYVALVAALVGGITFIFSVMVFPQGPQRVLVQHIFLASWWVWCLGAVVAELIHHEKHLFLNLSANRLALFFIFLSSIAIAYFPFHISLQLQRFALPLLCAGILYFTLQDNYHFRRPKFLIHVGLVSYSLYLFHPLALLITQQMYLDFLLQAVVALLLGLGFAVLSYYLVEEPGVKFGKAVLFKINSLTSAIGSFANFRRFL